MNRLMIIHTVDGIIRRQLLCCVWPASAFQKYHAEYQGREKGQEQQQHVCLQNPPEFPKCGQSQIVQPEKEVK